jgi:hypothetical protein
MHHLRTRNVPPQQKKRGGPQATPPGSAAPTNGAPCPYLIIAIHGSPMSRNAAMKITPNTAPSIQKFLAGR